MAEFLLHLLRHGAPETPGLLMGRTDGLPTPEGIAACMAQTADIPFDHIVSSDLRRTLAAAKAIAAQRALAVAVDPRWRELDFGQWDGLAPDHVDPDALSRFQNDPDACPPPEGERWSALVDRAMAALGDLSPRPTLALTHGGTMRAVLAGLFGFTQGQLWGFDLPYGTMLSLRVWTGGDRPYAQIAGLWP